jgi:hypothetical protein
MVGQNDRSKAPLLRFLTNCPNPACLARRKSGKTVFVQRIFNQLWNKNGITIPFFLMWLTLKFGIRIWQVVGVWF